MRWLKRPKIKRFFFLFFVYEVAVYFFGLFDVCVKQCPTINRNFILLSCSNNGVSKPGFSVCLVWDRVPSVSTTSWVIGWVLPTPGFLGKGETTFFSKVLGEGWDKAAVNLGILGKVLDLWHQPLPGTWSTAEVLYTGALVSWTGQVIFVPGWESSGCCPCN